MVAAGSGRGVGGEVAGGGRGGNGVKQGVADQGAGLAGGTFSVAGAGARSAAAKEALAPPGDRGLQVGEVAVDEDGMVATQVQRASNTELFSS